MSKRLILLGAPGSGKGTQAAILATRLGVPSVSTGEMLRAAVAADSDLGQRVATTMAAGDLVDDETMAAVMRERLGQEDARSGFILDGYPRTQGQAETLAAILDDLEWTLDAVVHIEVPEAVLVQRALARQRADDREEVIRQRLRVYRQRTQPLIDRYRASEALRVVDGNRSIDEVAAGIMAVLEVTN